ncbi:MAG: N-glycosylase/DNA lyase [Candidatus Anstonellaceae archaeon]
MKTEKGRQTLLQNYRRRKGEIESRLLHFESIGKKGGPALFEELAFCILTPQSKAFSCDSAIKELKQKGLLHKGNTRQISGVLSKKTRFHNKKAEYLVAAREKFSKDGFESLKEATFHGTEKEAREVLLKLVKGIGWKEASHYLRNVGRGKTIAILDRHILKNLEKHGVIRMPKTLTKKRYLEIEKKMGKFCREIGIPMPHLDLLLWAEETGRVFK